MLKNVKKVGQGAVPAILSVVLAVGLTPLPIGATDAYAADVAEVALPSSDVPIDEGSQLEAPQDNAETGDGQASGAAVGNVDDAVTVEPDESVVSDEGSNADGKDEDAAVVADEPGAGSTQADGTQQSGQTDAEGTNEGKSAGSSADGNDSAKLDPANLADGTYTVDVSLRNISDLGSASMAASAINNTDELVVKDGAYTLELKLGAVRVGSIVGSVSRVDYYPSFTVSGSSITTSGSGVQSWAATASNTEGPAPIPVVDSTRTDGYLPVGLYSDQMPVSPQKAAVKIDWSTLKKVSEDTDTVEPAQVPDSPDTAPADTDESQEANKQEANELPAPTSTEKKVFEVGHVYSAPIYFTKSGTSETSMAAQYFGGTAYVRPQSNGMLNVRFATNRPDYVESVSYNGASAAVTASSDSTREFSIDIPYSETNTSVPLSFVITPMKEMGVSSVSADMHLYLSQAQDLGSDAGQVASASGGSNALPATGDDCDLLIGMFAMLACIGGALVLGSRRKLEEESE